MSFERRQDFRANVVIAVEVRDARGFSLHSTRDISRGGVYFDRAIPHSVGARVQLAFTLPGEAKAIRCDGEVVNVPDKQGYGMGIRFLDIAPADAESIESFAKELVEGS
jgi:uncharacterized protein (TIGR02266 family)